MRAVIRTKDKLARGEKRLLAAIPVFEDMAGQAVESSLLAAGRSLIAENNYGHLWSFNQRGDMSSTGGLPGSRASTSGRTARDWSRSGRATRWRP